MHPCCADAVPAAPHSVASACTAARRRISAGMEAARGLQSGAREHSQRHDAPVVALDMRPRLWGAGSPCAPQTSCACRAQRTAVRGRRRVARCPTARAHYNLYPSVGSAKQYAKPCGRVGAPALGRRAPRAPRAARAPVSFQLLILLLPQPSTVTAALSASSASPAGRRLGILDPRLMSTYQLPYRHAQVFCTPGPPPHSRSRS